MFPLFDVTQVPGQRFNLWHKETTNFHFQILEH